MITGNRHLMPQQLKVTDARERENSYLSEWFKYLNLEQYHTSVISVVIFDLFTKQCKE